MNKAEAKKLVIYNKKDEHVQMMIGQNLSLCQGSMMGVIDDVKRTAEKAHERIDKTNERVLILDNSETGKVTTMWKESQQLKKDIRNALFAIFATILVSQITNYFINNGRGISKQELADSIKTAIIEATKK